MNHQRRIFILILLLAFVTSCFEINSVTLPVQVNINSSFTIQMNARTTDTDAESKYGMIGVQLHESMKIDSIKYTATNGSGKFYFLENDAPTKYQKESGIITGWTDSLANKFGLPAGYKWEVWEMEFPYSAEQEINNYNLEIYAKSGSASGTYQFKFLITESAYDLKPIEGEKTFDLREVGDQITVLDKSSLADVDGDGQITPVDVSYLLQYIVGARVLSANQLLSSDVNGDTFVNSLDASYILQKVLTPAMCFPIEPDCNTPKVGSGEINLTWRQRKIDGKQVLQLEFESNNPIRSLYLSSSNFQQDWVIIPDGWMSAFHHNNETIRFTMASGAGLTSGVLLQVPLNEAYNDLISRFEAFKINGIDVDLPPIPITTSERRLDDEPIPSLFAIHPNYPNPFNPTTTIQFELPTSADVSVTIHDLNGRVVMHIPSAIYNAGRHNLQINASRLGSGVYVYMVQAGKYEGTGKMTLLK